MTVNNDNVVLWFDNRKGKLTYSMNGSRNGSDGTADCSGSITQAIRDAGGIPYAYLYSTVTLDQYLKSNGYERISVNQEWNAQRGDIVQMSWGQKEYGMAASAGAGGHVGVMKDANVFISTDYWTGGQVGTAVSEHDFNAYYNSNPPNYFEVWRLTTQNEGNSNKPETKPTPQPKNDVDYMRQYGKVRWNGKQFSVDDRSKFAGIWQVISNELGGLKPTPITSDVEWINNGVPMESISWTDGTPQSSVNGNRFKFNQDLMTIVDYDVASNGIAIMLAGHRVWVDATVAKNA